MKNWNIVNKNLMFKPSFLICVSCAKKRLIVVKAGYCKMCNEKRKRERRQPSKGNLLPLPKDIFKHFPVIGLIKGRPISLSDAVSFAKEGYDRLQVGKTILKKFKPRKKTGQLEIFSIIWEDREHISEVSGKPLLPKRHPRWHWQFSHYLPKSHYRKFMLEKKNIFLCLPEEHTEWGEKSIKNDPKWKPFLEKYQELKQEYYEKSKEKDFKR